MCECHGSSEMTILTDALCHSKSGKLKNPHCSMAMSAKHRSKVATGNGNASMWVKNSQVGRNKQKQILK